MAKFICEYCGKEFEAKQSSKRKYCCKECSNLGRKGKKIGTKVERIKVVCATCGKEEYVLPCRAKNYHCCSVACLAKYNSERYSQKISCICPICGKEFKLKPYSYNRIKSTPCCSKECASKLKETTFIGKNNHQYGLKGKLNASFKDRALPKKNNHVEDMFVYAPEYPDSNKDGRITQHRLNVLRNHKKFNNVFFEEENKIVKFNPKYNINVHHIDGNHSNNALSNLIPLTRKQHKTIHNNLLQIAEISIHNIIGVLKQGELLETPKVDNQQLSLNSNIFESSETNSRFRTGKAEESNTDTSALLNNICNIINDYIVQTKNITIDGYNKSIEEILESEIKSSE